MARKKSTQGGSGGEKTKVFAGRYAYKKPLGRGAGGSVYLAEDLRADRREVALKVLSDDAVETVQGKMLRREFEILSKLDHPNLVKVYDYGSLPGGGVFLAEEYIDGFSLQDARALLEPRALIDPTLQVLQGLAYLHGMGMIHRDVKPANVMLLWLDDPSARPMIKLVDFGLSSMNPKRDTLRGGTRSYMAPEIIRGEKGERRSDLYSLGVTLYYALCGVLPFGPRSKEDPPPTEENFRPPDPHRLNEEVPLELSRFTMALLRQVPDVDYADAGEALQALAADAGQLEARSVGQMANSLDVAAAPVIRGYFERGILPRRVEEDDLILEWLTMRQPASNGQMYLIRGDDGVGKSRLLGDVKASSKLSGHLVLSHSGAEVEGPYALITEMLERLVEVAESQNIREVAEYAVPIRVRRVMTDLHIAAIDEETPSGINPAWIREAIEAVVEHLDFDTVVHFVDDLDRVDEPSLSLLDAWYESADADGPRPNVVATTSRGTVYRRFSRRDAVQVLPIEGVTCGDVEDFFRDRLGIEDIGDEWLETVGDAADGRPAYIEELCRYLIDAGMLWRESETKWGARLEDIEALGVPETLRESLRRRVTEVGAAGRECLELLALMQRPLTWESARTLLERGGSSSEEAEETLQTVQWRHLITTELTQGGRYVRVVHRQLADAIADMISPEWRRALHRRIGRQVATDWQHGVGEALEAATHLDQGGLREEAAPYFELAGDAEVFEGRYRDAGIHFRQAIEGTEREAARALLYLKTAKVELARFDADACIDQLDRAVHFAEKTDSRWLKYRVYAETGHRYLSLGESGGARRWAERLEQAVPELVDGLEAADLLAMLELHDGDLSSGRDRLDRALERGGAPVVPRRVVSPLTLRARIDVLAGEHDDARRRYGRARSLMERVDDPSLRASWMLWYGSDLRRMEELTKAGHTLREAVSLLADHGRPNELVEALFQLAWAEAGEGEIQRANARVAEALVLTDRLNHAPLRRRIGVLSQGLRLMESGGTNDTLVAGVEERIEELNRGDGLVLERAEILMALGTLFIQRGLRQRGPELLQRGRQLAYESGAAGLLPPVDE